MLIFAAATLAMAAMLSPNTASADEGQYKAQGICGIMATTSQWASRANASGIDEEVIQRVWEDNVEENMTLETRKLTKEIGAKQIHQVYSNHIINEAQAYWDGYQTCMSMMK